MICKENFSEKIEILGLDLFETHKEEIGIVEQFQKYFGPALGWHYYLDIAWIVREISSLPRGALILDAGAGSGLLQFILAELGYNVLSADFLGRNFSTQYSSRYNRIIYSLNSQKVSIANSYTRHLKANYSIPGSGLLARLSKFLRGKQNDADVVTFIDNFRFTSAFDAKMKLMEGDVARNCGRIFLYRCDLRDLSLLPNGLVDGVVSISALEHNDHEGFVGCVDELLRVTKTYGKMCITVSAAQDKDWFHAPSKGWCYSDRTLKRFFDLSESTWSNFSRKDELFQLLKNEGNELHNRLAPVYFESGDNGMPWGKWDPQYQPVGIVKVKQPEQLGNSVTKVSSNAPVFLKI